MDRAVPPLSQLQYVVEKVAGRAEVHLDTGITHGGDIAAAMALGADFVWVGRSYLYGLMAGGQDGVTRAVEILTQELVRTMKLLGVTSIAELDTRHIKMLQTDLSKLIES
jgi:isopentenyl diphosphate isomerase/L-lactate dehydrogenase-like FMN-dependent dehydrogenase